MGRHRAGYDAVDLSTMSDDERAREIYAHFGLAMYAASTLEHAIVNALCVIDFLPKWDVNQNRQKFETCFEAYFISCFKKTFGKLVNQLSETGILSEELSDEFNSALTKRNHLAHYFFRDFAEHWFTLKGQQEMIDYCDEAVRIFSQLDMHVESVAKPYREAMGISEELMEKTFSEEIARVTSMRN